MSANPEPLATPAVSERALRMPRSSIRRIYNAVKEVESGGENVIPLHIGDPDFDLPERISTAISKALADGHTHYSPMPGIPQLRAAIARRIANRWDIPYCDNPADDPQAITPLHIVCSQGATQALNACAMLTTSRGDSILYPQVYFPNYMQQCALGGIDARFYPFDQRFQPLTGKITDSIDSSTRAILVNTPSNPTGALFPPETVKSLYHAAAERNIWVISDEAYVDYVYTGKHVSPVMLDWQLPPHQRRTLGVFSFSKSYAATGLRLGWTVCPTVEVAAQLALINEPLTGSLTTPLQHGMLAALIEDDTAARRDSLRQRSELAAGILSEHGFHVQPVAGGMFYFLDISATGLTGDEFADALLAEKRVAVVPGSGFGLVPRRTADGGISYEPNELARRCIRLCFGLPNNLLIEGVNRMGEFITSRS